MARQPTPAKPRAVFSTNGNIETGRSRRTVGCPKNERRSGECPSLIARWDFGRNPWRSSKFAPRLSLSNRPASNIGASTSIAVATDPPFPGNSKEGFLGASGKCVHAQRTISDSLCQLLKANDTALCSRRLGRLAKPLKANIQSLRWPRHLDWHEFRYVPLRGAGTACQGRAKRWLGKIEGREITDLLRMNTLSAGGHASAARACEGFEDVARDCSTPVDRT